MVEKTHHIQNNGERRSIGAKRSARTSRGRAGSKAETNTADSTGAQNITSQVVRDEHRLRLAVSEQVAVGFVGNSEHVRRKLLTTLVRVQLDHVVRVDREKAVGVDRNAEKTRVRL